MLLSFLLLQAVDTSSPDALTKLTELLAAHGVYALVVIFLFYQQRKTFADMKAADTSNRDALMKIYKQTIWATYILMAIAIPIWVYATFIYAPVTTVWGDVANLTQMTGTPANPAQIIVDEQVTPQQRGVNFYTNPQPDPTDPEKQTVFWALRENGQQSQVPLVFSHRFKELVPAGSAVPLDPSNPSQPSLRDISQRKTFVVALGTLASAQSTNFDYRYYPDAKDPMHAIGTLQLLRNGSTEPVPMQDDAPGVPHAGELIVSPSLLAWFVTPSVFAQAPRASVDAATAGRLLPLLGSKDLKQQLMSEQALVSAQNIPWQSVRSVLADPKSTADHTLLVHNLANVITSWSAKGVAVPADIRLDVAKASYSVSDFKTAAPLFNGLNDNEVGKDSSVYYDRGVSNLQLGNYQVATKDLTTYASKAPTPAAKAVAQSTLSVAKLRSQTAVKK